MEGHGILWKVLEDYVIMENNYYGNSWKLMEPHGRPWNLMEGHGTSWKAMEPSRTFHDILIVNSI